MKKTSKIISSVVSVSIVLGTAVVMGVCSPELAPGVIEEAHAVAIAVADTQVEVENDDESVLNPALAPASAEVAAPVVPAPAAEPVVDTNTEVVVENVDNTPASVPAKPSEPVVSSSTPAPAPVPAPVKKVPCYKSTIVLPDGSVCPIELNKVGKGNSANTVWLFMGDLDLTNNHYAWICGHNPGKFAPVASMNVGSRFVIWDVNGVDRQFEVVNREVHCVGEPFYCQDQNLIHSETMWIQTCIGGGKVAFLRCKMI